LQRSIFLVNSALTAAPAGEARNDDGRMGNEARKHDQSALMMIL
jgi:hypothetical protein